MQDQDALRQEDPSRTASQDTNPDQRIPAPTDDSSEDQGQQGEPVLDQHQADQWQTVQPQAAQQYAAQRMADQLQVALHPASPASPTQSSPLADEATTILAATVQRAIRNELRSWTSRQSGPPAGNLQASFDEVRSPRASAHTAADAPRDATPRVGSGEPSNNAAGLSASAILEVLAAQSQTKEHIKRVQTRLNKLDMRLGQGPLWDARFFYQINEVLRGAADYRLAAEKVREEWADAQYDPSTPMSAKTFADLAQEYFKSAHTSHYISKLTSALAVVVQQGSITIQAYHTARNRDLAAALMLCSGPEFNDAQRLDLERTLVKAFISGLKLPEQDKRDIMASYEESAASEGALLTFNMVKAKAMGKFSALPQSEEGSVSSGTPAPLNATIGIKRNAQGAQTQQDTARLAREMRTLSQAVSSLENVVHSSAATQAVVMPSPPITMPPRSVGFPSPSAPPAAGSAASYPPLHSQPVARSARAQVRYSAVGPDECHRCFKKQMPHNHPYHSCILFPGCGRCGGNGHYADTCTQPCAVCSSLSGHTANCPKTARPTSFRPNGRGGAPRRRG